jgi:hypothetical protein
MERTSFLKASVFIENYIDFNENLGKYLNLFDCIKLPSLGIQALVDFAIGATANKAAQAVLDGLHVVCV